MRIARKYALWLFTLMCAAPLVASFAAQAAADDDDPPSRVARLAYTQGSVSFQPAGTDDWVTAGINRPVTTGDRIWSDTDGRLELQLDGSLLRLSNSTGISFLNLSDHVTQIQLSAGTLLVRVRRLDESETYEIDTPNLAFSVLRAGLYRISVNEAGDSTAIRIRSGDGEVSGGGAAYSLRANDFVTFSGTDQLSAESDGNDNREDQFDSWAANRDRHYETSNSSRYVSADVVGYEDLDDHGTWRRTPDNGNVWFPRTSDANWAPYHNGHWDYIEPWGYTWVDDEPWGFAPFHYGRWVNYEGSWGWVPAAPRTEGAEYVRPVYAPALVAWVGGPHFAIGVGAGGDSYGSGVSVGWFPLGPREVYVPSYRVSRNYVNNVNVSNTTVNTTVVNNYYNTTVVNNNVNVTNVKYVNQSVRGAVVATTPQAFTSAQPVAKNAVKLDQREVAAAPVRAFTPSAAPAKQAVLGTGAAAAKPPAAVQTRAVVAKVAPPPPPPTFEKQQAAIKSNGGKPLSVVQVKQIQPAPTQKTAVVKVAPPAAPKPVAAAPKPAQNNRPAPATNTPQTVAPNATRPPERPATPETAKPAETKPTPPPNTAQPPNRPPDRPADRPVTPDTSRPTETKPATPPARPDRPVDRPVTPHNPPPPANRPPSPSVVHPNEAAPPPARPVLPPSTNAQLDAKHQQEQEQLRAKQLQERQDMQQQQEKEHAKVAQQPADMAKKQQIEQQHQQQTQQLLQKHAAEQKALQEKQQQERQAPPKPKKENPPPPKPN